MLMYLVFCCCKNDKDYSTFLFLLVLRKFVNSICKRETNVVFPSVYVRPSVCLSVRLSVTLSSSEPYRPERFVQKKMKKKSIINIPSKVVQQKIKIQFFFKLLRLWSKNHFLNLCFVQAISQ